MFFKLLASLIYVLFFENNNYFERKRKIKSDYSNETRWGSNSYVAGFTPRGYAGILYFNDTSIIQWVNNHSMTLDKTRIYKFDVACAYLPWAKGSSREKKKKKKLAWMTEKRQINTETSGGTGIFIVNFIAVSRIVINP